MNQTNWQSEAARIVRGHCKSLSHGLITPDDLSTRQLCTLYYVTSRSYYKYDESIISDGLFDNVCKELRQRKIDKFVYDKPDMESLDAGTGFDLKYSDAIVQLTEEIIGHDN